MDEEKERMLAIRMGLSRSGQAVVRAREATCWANKQHRRSDRNPLLERLGQRGHFASGGLGWPGSRCQWTALVTCSAI